MNKKKKLVLIDDPDKFVRIIKDKKCPSDFKQNILINEDVYFLVGNRKDIISKIGSLHDEWGEYITPYTRETFSKRKPIYYEYELVELNE